MTAFPVRLAFALVLPLCAAVACGADNANAAVDCERRFAVVPSRPCTVTFERGRGPARASVAGTGIELREVTTEGVVLGVDGRERSIPVDQREPQGPGPYFALKSVTEDVVVLEVVDVPEV
ncbi:hypothetical protein ACFHW2_01675 [Actinomadura sp. LOL_016]|uniref:hypothetical protein n=1 Tax=unclassified Actinomadura TaxID=2626254 RepID=UPI003A810017